MPQILLSNGQSALVDDEDFEKFKGMAWVPSRIGSTSYASNRKMVGRKITYTSLHRAIVGAKDGELVDHINGDGLDNRRENLRIANKSQNAINSKLRADNTTGYRGVSYMPKRDRYQARLFMHGKKITSKFFHTAIEAAEAYKEIALRVYGEFVRNGCGGVL